MSRQQQLCDKCRRCKDCNPSRRVQTQNSKLSTPVALHKVKSESKQENKPMSQKASHALAQMRRSTQFSSSSVAASDTDSRDPMSNENNDDDSSEDDDDDIFKHSPILHQNKKARVSMPPLAPVPPPPQPAHVRRSREEMALLMSHLELDGPQNAIPQAGARRKRKPPMRFDAAKL